MSFRVPKTPSTVLIMAGGTGGHVFPALAVAEALLDRGVKVAWLGTKRGIESKVVPAADIPISYLTIQGIRGKGIFGLLKAPILLVRAIIQAVVVLRQLNPISVLGMGGFASAPGGIACWLMRKPLIIHEQNAIAGTANKLLSYVADIALQAFPAALRAGEHVGNPVRRDIAALPTPAERFQGRVGKLKLLILGGSLGAVVLNGLVPQALALMPEPLRPEVWHQAGRNNIDAAQQAYQQHDISARIEPFIEDMSSAYAWADFVICRAGALTVAEITAVGIGALYVPYPYAIDDHQTKNAEWVVAHGAGVLIQQANLTPEILCEQLQRVADSREALLEMADKARELAILDAADVVAGRCLEVSHV